MTRHSWCCRRDLRVKRARPKAGFLASRGTGLSPICPTTFTTRRHHASWRRRGTWLTSRSPRAAITLALFALFRSCADSSAHGALHRRGGGGAAGAVRCPRNYTDWSGHDLLRGGVRPEGWLGTSAGEGGTDRKATAGELPP